MRPELTTDGTALAYLRPEAQYYLFEYGGKLTLKKCGAERM